MKVYTKNQIKTKDGIPTGAVIWFMHDTENGYTLKVMNFNHFYPSLPYVIDGTADTVCFEPGNIIIDEMEFHEVYDKAIDSLQNFVP